VEGLEGMKIYEKGYIKVEGARDMAVNSDRCLAYNGAIQDAIDYIINELT